MNGGQAGGMGNWRRHNMAQYGISTNVGYSQSQLDKCRQMIEGNRLYIFLPGIKKKEAQRRQWKISVQLSWTTL